LNDLNELNETNAPNPPQSFSDLGLHPAILQAVAAQGYTTPTPIQQRAIPVVLSRRDVMAGAQTGTGKTAAFCLPILHLLAPLANRSVSPAMHPVRALILTPTRELAMQVEENLRAYGANLQLRSAIIYGGVDMAPQTEALRRGVEIVVATPGRLLDHMQQRSTSLGKVDFLVLDEADRMLDMGFLPDIRRILDTLPAQRQNLLFSATFNTDIRKLAAQIMHSPVLVEVAPPNAVAERVQHLAYRCEDLHKRAVLVHLVESRQLTQVLVFVATKRGAARLARELQRDRVSAAAIHGDMSQPERTKALDEFKSGAVRVLVATDVAARGLDIEDLPHVVNYELPYSAEDYIHRIGRTGRAGASGEAISLVSKMQERHLRDIEKLIKAPLPLQAAPIVESADSRYRERAPNRAAERRLERRPSQPEAAPPADGFDPNRPYLPDVSSTVAAPVKLPPPRRSRSARAVLLTALKE
jgi:ATP-dependent RNA helicase RhlE